MKNRVQHKTRHFTLIELLVVVAIIMILLGIATGSWTRIVLGSSVDRAGRMVSSQLSLVRAEAVAKRRRVALVMPGSVCFTETSTTTKFPRPYNYSAMRAAYVDDDNKFQKWVEGTSWVFLPEGALIAQCDNAIVGTGGELTLSGTDYVPSGTCAVIETCDAAVVLDADHKMDYVDENGDDKTLDSGNIRAVVFKKDGSCSAKAYITIMEGIVPQGQTSPINTQQSNLNVLEISSLTGKVRFLFH